MVLGKEYLVGDTAIEDEKKKGGRREVGGSTASFSGGLTEPKAFT
jgi:hypothetical protein